MSDDVLYQVADKLLRKLYGCESQERKIEALEDAISAAFEAGRESVVETARTRGVRA